MTLCRKGRIGIFFSICEQYLVLSSPQRPFRTIRLTACASWDLFPWPFTPWHSGLTGVSIRKILACISKALTPHKQRVLLLDRCIFKSLEIVALYLASQRAFVDAQFSGGGHSAPMVSNQSIEDSLLLDLLEGHCG